MILHISCGLKTDCLLCKSYSSLITFFVLHSNVGSYRCTYLLPVFLNVIVNLSFYFNKALLIRVNDIRSSFDKHFNQVRIIKCKYNIYNLCFTNITTLNNSILSTQNSFKVFNHMLFKSENSTLL